jgi:hypothetical protein
MIRSASGLLTADPGDGFRSRFSYWMDRDLGFQLIKN